MSKIYLYIKFQVLMVENQKQIIRSTTSLLLNTTGRTEKQKETKTESAHIYRRLSIKNVITLK